MSLSRPGAPCSAASVRHGLALRCIARSCEWECIRRRPINHIFVNMCINNFRSQSGAIEFLEPARIRVGRSALTGGGACGARSEKKFYLCAGQRGGKICKNAD